MDQVFELVLQFITENNLQVAMALYILGAFIKNSEKIKDCLIPFILLPLGIVGTVAIKPEDMLVAEAVMQGIYATGAAVLGSQVLKQGAEFHEAMMND